MNLRVAESASLISRRLIVETRNLGNWVVDGGTVALQAQQVDLADPQQPRVGRAVRRVAASAALHFHGDVLKNEWSHLIGVALAADRESGRRDAQLAFRDRAVWIVAIRALDQAHVHAMAVGPCELGFLRGMAAVAEKRLGLDQKIFRRGGVMRGVAIQAAHAIRQVDGATVIAVLQAVLMAAQTALADHLSAALLERKNLARVSSRVNVCLPGAMAVLAAMLAGFDQRVVRRVRETLVVDVFVAGLASVRASVTG